MQIIEWDVRIILNRVFPDLGAPTIKMGFTNVKEVLILDV